MALQRGGKLRAFGFLDGDEVLDVHRVQHLAAKALCRHAGADAFARGIDRRRRASGAAADDQHLKRRFVVHFFSVAGDAAGVNFGDDFGQFHAALAKALAVQKHRGHAHDVAVFNFFLEHAAVNRRVRDAGVEHAHQIERLHHVGAVVARQRVVGFKVEAAFQAFDLLQQVGGFFRWMAAHLQQRQHQRSEFVTERHAGKAHAGICAGVGDEERGFAHVQRIVFDHGNFVGLGADVLQEFAQLGGGCAVVQRGYQFDRALQALQIGFQLGLEGVVEHGKTPEIAIFGVKKPGRQAPGRLVNGLTNG